jgi:hypothetical protein
MAMIFPREGFWSRAATGEGCWLWQGSISSTGYGYVKVCGKRILAHRLAYLVATGTDPGRMLVCHRCDVPLCVRPEHLFLGTDADNVADMCRKGRARPCVGEKQGRAKLTEAAVRDIRRRTAAGTTFRRLAQEYRVSARLVSYVARHMLWRHVS